MSIRMTVLKLDEAEVEKIIKEHVEKNCGPVVSMSHEVGIYNWGDECEYEGMTVVYENRDRFNNA